MKARYYSPEHNKEFDIEIVRESKRYYWFTINWGHGKNDTIEKRKKSKVKKGAL